MSIHIGAKKEEIADIVIMPGDPLRAKYIAENYLEDIKLINEVRNMLGYTGYYKGKRITVMGSGMGIPSMGIYATELYRDYDVQTIIRVGTCGSYVADLKLGDVVLVDKAFSTTYFDNELGGENVDYVSATIRLNKVISNVAKELGYPLNEVTAHTSEVFTEVINFDELVGRRGCSVVEMEAFALFYLANKYKRNAATLLTVSDELVDLKVMSSEERELGMQKMVNLVLESTLKL